MAILTAPNQTRDSIVIPMTIVIPYKSSSSTGPTVPTTGQIWPRSR